MNVFKSTQADLCLWLIILNKLKINLTILKFYKILTCLVKIYQVARIIKYNKLTVGTEYLFVYKYFFQMLQMIIQTTLVNKLIWLKSKLNLMILMSCFLFVKILTWLPATQDRMKLHLKVRITVKLILI